MLSKLSVVIFILISFVIGASLSMAQEQNGDQEEAIQEIAKKRLYPGGVDEQDLEVQTNLIKPQKIFGEEETQAEEQQEEF